MFEKLKDKMRREAQAEAADKFFETAPERNGLPSRAAGQPKAVLAELEEKSLPPAEKVPASGMFDTSPPEVEKYFADTSEKVPRTEKLPSDTVEGSDGYVFQKLADGAFKIVKSPRSSGGQIVRPGSKYYTAIKEDFEKHAALA